MNDFCSDSEEKAQKESSCDVEVVLDNVENSKIEEDINQPVIE